VDKQLQIPGLEILAPKPPPYPSPRPLNIQQQIADLQDRVLQLELELTLLGIQISEDKDHA